VVLADVRSKTRAGTFGVMNEDESMAVGHIHEVG
jgi:hypothetical protein